MVEISLNKVCKNYAFNNVLDNVSFEIKTNERVALVGSNGCGKTTTLKIIIGKEKEDSGLITIAKNRTIGYLEQITGLKDDNVTAKDIYLQGVQNILDLEKKINKYLNEMDTSKKSLTILDKMQEEYRILGGYELQSKIDKIAHGFKLTDHILNMKYNNLSGGEKTILHLASLILSNPDILLLDEPTNHLDIDTLEWFEEYLKTYRGTVLIVSHDRYFMDRVVNKVISLENGKSDIYEGNYSYYLDESEKRFIRQFQKYKIQQQEIKAIKEAIKRYKEWGEKSDNPIFFRRAHAMEKRLEKMEMIEKPVEKKNLNLRLNSSDRSSTRVIEINNLNLKIENKLLFENANMIINFGERICLMGQNGSGKTTLIKEILNNNNENIYVGNNVKIGYIPQEISFPNEEETIYEFTKNFFSGNESELRSKLYQFYFNSDAIDKKIKYISGGEKVRLKLLELIEKEANLLILDEPTNHIDIDTKEILEESLLNYQGTIFFVSHDRYFINKISSRIINLENKKLVSYLGNYDYLKSHKKEEIKPVIKEEKIVINGTNRLNEFLKDANKIEQITIGCSGQKVYKIRKKSKVFYLKIANHLSQESIRLDYLQGKINCPEKVFYEKYNGMSYILTKEVKGMMLCDDYYCNENPSKGIDIIVEAFNAIYNINYEDCIIDETIDVKIKRIEDRFSKIKNSEIDENVLERFKSKEAILKYLKGNKPKQLIGFTHGDMSLPNILSENNHFNGLIDVSECGLSDIYFDLVICEISIERNYGKKYIDEFYEKIGIEKDEFKSEYYRILMSLY